MDMGEVSKKPKFAAEPDAAQQADWRKARWDRKIGFRDGVSTVEKRDHGR
jgi:hypothetical protein